MDEEEMIIGAIRGANIVMKAPEGMENCVDIPALREPECITTAWLPTPDELAALNAGEPVYVTVWGQGMPPLSVWVPK